MLRNLLSKSSSYLKYRPRQLTATYSRNLRISSAHSCDTENFHDDFRERKYNQEFAENRISHKLDPDESESVLFEFHQQTLNPINSSETVEDVLQYLKSNHKISFHLYGHVFQTIFRLYKSGKSQLSAEEICRSKEMQTFSSMVNKNVRYLKVEDAVSILKVLTFFKISTNSILCQNLLQMISQQVNRLGLSQIMFLHFILSDCARSPLVDALKIAIPVVFETHIRSQLDVDDTSTLASAVCFAFEQEAVSDDTRELLTKEALEKINDFSLTEAVGMVRRLSFSEDGPENVQTLYSELMNVLRENVDHLESVNIKKLIHVTVDTYLHVHESFFDETLVKKAIDNFIKNEVPLTQTGHLLWELNRISYYCPNLLDYMDQQFLLVTNFNTLPRALVISFVKACSNCSHRPNNWTSYEQKILSYLEKEKDNIPNLLASVVTDLLVLKCWPKALVEFYFREDYLRKSLDKEKSKLHASNFLTMYSVVKLLYSDYYAGPYPPTHVLDKALSIITVNADKEYPLLGALEVGLGGSQYVLSNVRTKLGQIIDYLLVKCKTGELHPMNFAANADGDAISYESLHMPPDSYPVAIVLLPPTSYCLDGLRMRGEVAISLRCLEAYGITVIPISHYQWLALQDCEKVAYLIDKIDRCVPITSSHKCSTHNL